MTCLFSIMEQFCLSVLAISMVQTHHKPLEHIILEKYYPGNVVPMTDKLKEVYFPGAS